MRLLKEAWAFLSKISWWTIQPLFLGERAEVPVSRLDSRLSCQTLICYYTTLHSLYTFIPLPTYFTTLKHFQEIMFTTVTSVSDNNHRPEDLHLLLFSTQITKNACVYQLSTCIIQQSVLQHYPELPIHIRNRWSRSTHIYCHTPPLHCFFVLFGLWRKLYSFSFFLADILVHTCTKVW